MVFASSLLTRIGIPLADLPLRSTVVAKPVIPNTSHTLRSPASINFVRNRMMYARAALNARREVSFGLRHIRERLSDAL